MQADARGPRDYEDHLYVNTQGLDAPELPQAEDSPKKDLFDMRTWGGPACCPLGLGKLVRVAWGRVLPLGLPV